MECNNKSDLHLKDRPPKRRIPVDLPLADPEDLVKVFEHPLESPIQDPERDSQTTGK